MLIHPIQRPIGTNGTYILDAKTCVYCGIMHSHSSREGVLRILRGPVMFRHISQASLTNSGLFRDSCLQSGLWS